MKKSLIYIALLLSCVAMAQHTTQPPFMQMQSTSAYAIGSSSLSHEMLVAPFSNEIPSDGAYVSGARKAPGSGISGGTGDQPTVQQPIGDALIPLFFMASVFAALTYLRRRRLPRTL